MVEKRRVPRVMFEPKKVLDKKGDCTKVNKKETIKNIRRTEKGQEFSCPQLHAKSDRALIKIAKEVGGEVIQNNPSSKLKF